MIKTNWKNNPSLALLISILAELENNKIGEASAALAYHALLSLAPLLVLAIIVASLLVDQVQFQIWLTDQMEAGFGIDPEIIDKMVNNVFDLMNNVYFTVIAMIAMFYSVSKVVGHIKTVFFRIFQVDIAGNELLKTLKQKIFSIGYTIFFLVAVFILTAGNLLASFLFQLFEQIGLNNLPFYFGELARTGYFVLVVTVAIFFLYRFMSVERIDSRNLLIGSLIAGVSFSLLNLLLSIYTAYSISVSIYGTLTSIIVFLLWLYFSAFAIFSGAILSKVLALRSGHFQDNRLEI